MTIGNPETIQAQVNVDEADIANIKVGEEASIVAIGYPDHPMKGTVKEIAITAKPPTTTSTLLIFVVKIQINDTNGIKLHPGMSARAEIFTSNSSNVLAVPIQAVVEEEDRSLNSKKHIVYKFDNGVARKLSVDTGIADDSYQQIRSGLVSGDRIITGPNRILRNLQDGDKVREKTQEETNKENGKK
jgi:HlyD family secretion protein